MTAPPASDNPGDGGGDGSGGAEGCPPVDILTRLSPERLRALVVDPGFAAVVKSGAVRGVLEQVLRIGGEVTAAVAGSRLVGYVTVHPIEPVRWEGKLYHRRWERLARGMELGSIEVSRTWRGRRIGERLVFAAMADGSWDGHILISEELSWHWDYENLHLTKREYRAMLQRLLGKGGFVEYRTDDPNVRLDPANIFMARVGPDVPKVERARFQALLVTGERG